MDKKLTKSELSSPFLLTKNKEKTWAFYLIHNFGHPISTAFEVIANLLKEKNKRLSLPLKRTIPFATYNYFFCIYCTIYKCSSFGIGTFFINSRIYTYN